MKKFGLIGKSLKHSFSKDFFNQKFKELNLKNYFYENYEITNINKIRDLIKTNSLSGLNVTIPYKQEIFNHLDKVDNIARKIGSVNTIKIENNKLIGYNTDIIGFERSIDPLIKERKKALILGNGGSSKTVQYVLNKKRIEYTVISRSGSKNYHNINKEDILNHIIIINTTPLGMFPNIESYPDIPYQYINKKHLIFDLIYNPEETHFIKKAKNKGCEIKNGLEMLKIQANESWKIWKN
jgi:shikimate dehydrogenase